MCGVILGECSGEEPADRDIPGDGAKAFLSATKAGVRETSGAKPAAAGFPRDGWEKAGEKADTPDWTTALSLEVGPPLGTNSLAVGFGVFLL